MLAFETRGDAYARGRQQGEAARALTLAWIEPHLRDLAGRVRAASAGEAIRRVEPEISRWRRQAAAVYPEGEAECCGIAAGLGLDEPTYFTALFSMRLVGVFAQCTTLGFRDAQGRPLLGKTDDLFLPELGKNVLETTYPDSGYRHVHLHFAGSVWTVAGMNEHGLAMGMNGIPGPAREQDGLPSLTALHTILPACATVAEAIAHLRELPLNFYGFSLLLGDAGGNMALVEKNGAGTVVLPEPPGGFCLHTNHILDAGLAAQSPPQREPIHTNGVRRYRNALRLLETLPRTEEGLRAFLADRSPDGAICQQGEEGLHTDFGVLFAPVEKRFVYWPGYPASAEPETIEVGRLFVESSPTRG
ncbi:MAG TPA: C45 family peptidase [Chthonomonadaceae bacterium]|nr:C45 family peptidase [Chthonomonadaceae bacterium]